MPVWIHNLITLSGAVLPVFIVIALGFWLRRGGMISATGGGELARLTYWGGLPCQLFVVVAATDLRVVFDLRSATAAVGGFIIGLSLVLWFSRRLAPAERGSLSTGMCRANAAFVGLPVVHLAAQTLAPEQGAHLMAAFAVLIPVMVPAFNVGSTLGFLLPQHGMTRRGWIKVMGELPKNPLIIASLAGVLVSLWRSGQGIGGTTGAVLVLLAGSATPLALLATGAELNLSVMRAKPMLLMIACMGKLLVLPALTWGIGRVIGADPVALAAAVVLMACPAAVASGPMARQLGGDEAVVAAIIVATTLVAPVTLVVWLAVLT
jgi:predicted permease